MSISGVGSSNSFDPTQMAQQFYKKADANGDGGIDKDELETMLSEGPDGENASANVDDIFEQMDTDGDGQISESEAEENMEKMGPPPPPPEEASSTGYNEDGESTSSIGGSLNLTA